MIFPMVVNKGCSVAGKQSGPVQAVKRRDHGGAFGGLLLATGIALALAACADSGWRNPAKSAAEQRQDLAACERDAEKASLASTGTTRNDYAIANAGLAGPGSKGMSPLELKDKSDLSKSYASSLGRCMRAEGYVQGHPADQHK